MYVEKIIGPPGTGKTAALIKRAGVAETGKVDIRAWVLRAVGVIRLVIILLGENLNLNIQLAEE
ncbi:unnamed protein product, partial [marine sediment metagenome]